MGVIERIKEIEAEMARTQKNKATGEAPTRPTKVYDHFMYMLSLLSCF